MTGWDDHLAKVRAAARLTEVAEDLKRRKLGARAFIRTDHVVRVQAWNQATPQSRVEVYAAPDADGVWWLWWSPDERLTPMTDVDKAALLIMEAVKAARTADTTEE